MSRKSWQTKEEEIKQWRERQQREREEATRRSLAQRKPVPGYRRLELEDVF